MSRASCNTSVSRVRSQWGCPNRAQTIWGVPSLTCRDTCMIWTVPEDTHGFSHDRGKCANQKWRSRSKVASHEQGGVMWLRRHYVATLSITFRSVGITIKSLGSVHRVHGFGSARVYPCSFISPVLGQLINASEAFLTVREIWKMCCIINVWICWEKYFKCNKSFLFGQVE